MKKIFLSLPMSGRTDEQIENTIYKEMVPIIIKSGIFEGTYVIKDKVYEGEYVFIDNFQVDAKEMAEMERQAREAVTSNLVYLGEAIKKLAYVDAVVFAEDFEEARGCMVELYVAYKYDIPCYIIVTNDEGEKVVAKMENKRYLEIIGIDDGLSYGEIDFSPAVIYK